jgi:prolyl-tRNA editing enzyme YbaK/EbsC (Cys-tRNA(Pro) deacylase)
VKGALDVHRELLAADVPHEVVRLRGQVVAADDLPRALGVPATSCVAVRCYVTDTGTVAVAVHAGVLPDPAAVLDALGAGTLRAASADEINAATDYAAGLVSPVCLPEGVQLLADAALTASDVVYCPLGEAGVALGIRTADLLKAAGARVAPLSSLPHTAPAAPPWSGGARVLDLDLRAPYLRLEDRPSGGDQLRPDRARGERQPPGGRDAGPRARWRSAG